MKTKSFKKDNVNVITLGCSKNLVDSENLLTQLRGNGISATHESEAGNSNIVIVNTCGFIENAKQESIDTILQYAEAKEKGDIQKLYVTGCLSERYREDLSKEITPVDAWFGTLELPLLLKKFNADYKHELVGERITTTAAHYAYLKIAEGCDRPCSFCAIPLMRGKHVSQPMELLVKQAESMAKRGTKELMLIAQDLTYYGLDLYKERKLAELVDRLSDVEGIEWIRLHYAYPSGFPMDVLDVMARKSNVCNYLDIPLQHGANEVLKLMRRGITREKTEELVHQIREKVPGIAIRTTLIAGHPGEGQAEFDELCSFVERMEFERLGVFTYSHEENTHAFSLEDKLSQEEKEERAAIVMDIQQGLAFKKNSALVGTTQKVLIDRKEGEFFIGRTEFDSPEVDNEVLINAKETYLSIGNFYQTKITDASDFDLYGNVISK